jgi:hypothetical protein
MTLPVNSWLTCQSFLASALTWDSGPVSMALESKKYFLVLSSTRKHECQVEAGLRAHAYQRTRSNQSNAVRRAGDQYGFPLNL